MLAIKSLTIKNVQYIWDYLGWARTLHVWLGKLKDLSLAVSFFTVNLKFVLKSNVVFPLNIKDGVTFHYKSFLIYQFKCDTCYIGHTTQRFENRIKQYVPSTIRFQNQTLLASLTSQNSDSTINQYVLAHLNYSKINMFSILDCSSTNFQLAILEALYITSLKSSLCKQ